MAAGPFSRIPGNPDIHRGGNGASRRAGTVAVLCLAAAALTLAGCDERKVPLKGERIPVLIHENQIVPDAALMNVAVELPRPVVNADWDQVGGNASHDMEHVDIPDQLKRAWRASIGAGTNEDQTLLPQPVVADGKIFTMDTESEVRAFDIESGKKLWSSDVLDSDDADSSIGGGIAYGPGRVYVTTGLAIVFALDANTGKEIWHQSVPSPMRAAPTFADGRLYVVTIDNEMFALNADTGKTLWTHSGIAEVAGLLGGSAPAVEGGTVIVPYSSGEIYALQVSNGRVLWSDNLGPVRRGDIASRITDIRGLPVVDKDQIYAISHGGRMVAIDFKTGRRVWDKLFGGVQTPWAAGDYVYVLTIDSVLICINRKDGRVRWAAELLRYGNPKAKEDPIAWNGPVLAGDRLIVANSRGEMLSISPYTGELLGKMKMGGPITVSPLVAGGTLYILTDNGELTALR
jgi:outer membrane protein assembly factor BamB